MKQCELWWPNLLQSAFLRPALLRSRDAAYKYLNKFVAVEITSTIPHIAMEVPLGKAEGLSKPCVANFDNIRTVPRSVLVKRIGQLGPSRREEAKRALGHSLGWDELISV